MNNAVSKVDAKQEADIPDFPEVLGDYAFDGGNTVHVSGKDDAGNTLGRWKDLNAMYKNADGAVVNLTVSAILPDGDGRTPTETRTIDGIEVAYNYDEYLLLPQEYEPLDEDVKSRMENDEHFFVSYGSSETETIFYSFASFVKDGVSYTIFTRNEISADELFKMAEELINR
ncbi:MAG: hypothetical protein IJ608_11855 [Lachnospiraceae bacterium]|nr:hypothetical protein [Lachnospiraceae bacterium]